MRVAMNVEQLFYRVPGGTGRYTARLTAALAAEFPADVVVPFVAWHGRRALEAGLARFELDRGLAPTVRLPLPRPALYDAWNVLGAPRPELFATSLRRADVVHSPAPVAPPVRGHLVVTVHDAAFALYPESYPRRGLRFHERSLTRVAERADVVLTVTHAAADEIVAHTPVRREQLRVVLSGVDHRTALPSEVDDALGRHDLAGSPYGLWVGSRDPRKHVGTLVQAFAELVRTDAVPHRLALVGPLGWLHRDLISDRDRAVLGDRLRVLGPVDEQDLRALYAGASLFAFPSLHEGFGLPVLEAMVQGTPVICSDIPALREVGGEAACLVPARDVGRWTEAIGELATDADRQRSLASAGRQRAAGFGWERTARETHAVYEELLAR